jgi:MoaA/NifB/PqqE/SkfB family radical SAM enzyme/SAM-dependent methyltransferase
MSRLRQNAGRFILKLGYPCNNACLFCHASDCSSTSQLSTEVAVARIREARELGATGVIFSGGEPTIRKDLPELAAEGARLGLRPGLITNGRMLSYRPLLKRLVKAGLDYVYMSLHGPETVHDAITQVPGSFAQSWQAIRLLAGLETVQLTVNSVVVKENLPHLQEVADLLLPLPRTRVKFTYVEPKGSALDALEIVPSPQLVAQRISALLSEAAARGLPLRRFGIDGLPHCLDPRFAYLQDDMFTHGIAALREVDEEHFYPIDYANMAKPRVCRACLLGDRCRGSWRKTFELFGHDFLAPVRGGVANSFNYFPAPKVGGFARSVTLEGTDLHPHYVTDTGDYSDAQLLTIRDELGQLYLQLDDQPMVNDFPNQLRKLRPVAGKSGHFSPQSGDPFGPDEQRVRRILSGLTGRVLDVGCGQTRYQDLLDQKLTGGDISYVGLDPYPGDSVRALAAGRRIELRVEAIEDSVFQAGEFDWVLVLRSHNHLSDLWTAYTRILGALKWGGRLLVVDNVSFGLVRPRVPRQTILALPPGAGLEHLRDHDHQAAAGFLQRFPLQLITRHEVGPDTGNQWLLLYQKLWPGGQVGRDTYPVAPAKN